MRKQNDEYKKALNYDPDNRDAAEEFAKLNKNLAQKYYEKGMDAFSRSDMSTAREMFQRSLEYEPDKPESLRAMDGLNRCEIKNQI